MVYLIMETQQNEIINELKEKFPTRFNKQNFYYRIRMFKSDTTLSLSQYGYFSLKKLKTPIKFSHNNEFLAKHFIGLSALQDPYYITNQYLYLFGKEDAVLLTLFESDVRLFAEYLYDEWEKNGKRF